MNVDVDSMVKTAIQAQHFRARSHVGQRSLRRFLHHVAELSGNRKLPTARHYRDLDAQQLTAKLRPREPRRDADLRHRLRRSIAELRHAEIFAETRARDLHVRVAIGLDDFDRYLAAYRRDLALQVSDPSLASVMANDSLDCAVGNLNIFRTQPIRL